MNNSNMAFMIFIINRFRFSAKKLTVTKYRFDSITMITAFCRPCGFLFRNSLLNIFFFFLSFSFYRRRLLFMRGARRNPSVLSILSFDRRPTRRLSENLFDDISGKQTGVGVGVGQQGGRVAATMRHACALVNTCRYRGYFDCRKPILRDATSPSYRAAVSDGYYCILRRFLPLFGHTTKSMIVLYLL